MLLISYLENSESLVPTYFLKSPMKYSHTIGRGLETVKHEIVGASQGQDGGKRGMYLSAP